MKGSKEHQIKRLTVIAAAALALLACHRSGVAGQTSASCGGLNITLCVDNTGSMGGGIDGVRVGEINIFATINEASNSCGGG